MGMLPYATRTISETLLWLILIFYVLARSDSLNIEVINAIDEAKMDMYLQTLINNPNCLAYEQFNLIVDTKDGTPNVQLSSEIKAGMIDITKFYDQWHHDCVRLAEPWDQPFLATGKLKVCGQYLLKNIPIINLLTQECSSDEKCVANRCVKKMGMCTPGTKDYQQCLAQSNGVFLSYTLELQDLEEMPVKKYAVTSYEGTILMQYIPEVIHSDLKEYSMAWAKTPYAEYMHCQTDFGGKEITKNINVMIAYPNAQATHIEEPTKHLGTLTIKMCKGMYGQSDNYKQNAQWLL